MGRIIELCLSEVADELVSLTGSVMGSAALQSFARALLRTTLSAGEMLVYLR